MSDYPPIASLRSFEAVARLGSVTLAAKELHVTHSAISQQIKVLEEMLGVRLFIVTDAGCRLMKRGDCMRCMSARRWNISRMPLVWSTLSRGRRR
jgi:hypothetical protein